MHIRMLKTEKGSLNGIKVDIYHAGMEYDLSATAEQIALASAFVKAGLAEEINQSSESGKTKNKSHKE